VAGVAHTAVRAGIPSFVLEMDGATLLYTPWNSGNRGDWFTRSRRRHVAVTQCSAFGEARGIFFRVSLAAEPGPVTKGVQRLCGFAGVGGAGELEPR